MTQLHAHFEYIPALSKITAIRTLERKLRELNMIKKKTTFVLSSDPPLIMLNYHNFRSNVRIALIFDKAGIFLKCACN